MVDNYLVFREEGLSESQISHRNAHNSRLLDSYNNSNIDLSLSNNNIHFVDPDGKSYKEIFEEKIKNGEINTKGLKEDAAHYSEIIVSVNMRYWKDKPIEEVYNFFALVNAYLSNKFGKENVLESVVHCDEVHDGMINYHLHFVGIPTVIKKRYFTKRSKEYQELFEIDNSIKKDDERLLKDIEQQVSHNKFFESTKDESHNLVYSYSVIQDEILDLIHRNGYNDIRRGNIKSNSIHLHPSQYKQIMDIIENDNKDLIGSIRSKELKDGNIIVNGEDFQKVLDIRTNLEKEKTAIDLCVDEINSHNDYIKEKEHELYLKNDVIKEQEKTQEENIRLRNENVELKTEISKLQYMIQLLENKLYNIRIQFKNLALSLKDLLKLKNKKAQDDFYYNFEQTRKTIDDENKGDELNIDKF